MFINVLDYAHVNTHIYTNKPCFNNAVHLYNVNTFPESEYHKRALPPSAV